MARCAYCGVETELYIFETPICVNCESAPPKEPESARKVTKIVSPFHEEERRLSD
jgi:hypothetical protein